MLQVKSPCSETAAGTHKSETFPIPRVLYVWMSRKEAIFDGNSTKEDIVDDLHVDDEDNIGEEESEVTVMEIDNFRNECMRETEEYMNRRLLQNHEVVNKGCSRKNKSHVWAFSLPFLKFARDDGAIWYYCTLCHCVEPITLQETLKGVIKIHEKTPPAYGTMSFMDMVTSSPVSCHSLSFRINHSQMTHLS